MPFRLKPPRRPQHGLMLGGPGHHETALWQAPRGAQEGEVDRLGARAGERDLGAVGAERLRGKVAGTIERGPGGAPVRVRARGISFGQVAQRRPDLWEDWRGSRVVEIDPAAISRGCGPAGGRAL